MSKSPKQLNEETSEPSDEKTTETAVEKELIETVEETTETALDEGSIEEAAEENEPPQTTEVLELPHQVQEVLEKLESSGFEAYIVGNCVKELILGNSPRTLPSSDMRYSRKVNRISLSSAFVTTSKSCGELPRISS